MFGKIAREKGLKAALDGGQPVPGLCQRAGGLGEAERGRLVVAVCDSRFAIQPRLVPDHAHQARCGEARSMFGTRILPTIVNRESWPGPGQPSQEEDGRGRWMDEFAVDHQGTQVRCSRDHWRRKIVENHPELSDRQEDVVDTISDPDLVLQDRDYGNRRHFIRRDSTGLYIDVVVEYRHMTEGIVGRMVTAMLRARLRSDDWPLYVRSEADQ